MHTRWVLCWVMLAACGSDVEEERGPVYYGQIDRLLGENCVECHSASPDRLAPFSLATYQDAVAAAERTPIAFSVMNRQMPPYFADDSGSCQTFHGNKWLTEEEIGTLVAWVNGARAAGDPAAAVMPPPGAPGLERVDARLDPGAAYQPDPALVDDYRCFVVETGLGVDRFLTGFHVRPGNVSVVHHAIVFSLDAAGEAAAIARDQAEPGLGYSCVGGPGIDGASFLAGWAPGNAAVRFPAGTGIRVLGGRKMVLQLHYNLAASNGQRDRTTVDLMLESAVADEARIVSVRADLNLPPGQPDIAAVGSRALPAGVSGRMWGATMHMHGRGIGGGLVRRAATDTCLLDLVGWSFHWQHFYWLDAPVAVAGGDRFEITCRYDTGDDAAPVTWGESTDDEMCIAYLYLSE